MVYIEGYDGKRGPNPPPLALLIIFPVAFLWAALSALYDWIALHVTARSVTGALFGVSCLIIVSALHCLSIKVRAVVLAISQTILGLSTILTSAIKFDADAQSAMWMAAGGTIALGKGLHDWRKERA